MLAEATIIIHIIVHLFTFLQNGLSGFALFKCTYGGTVQLALPYINGAWLRFFKQPTSPPPAAVRGEV